MLTVWMNISENTRRQQSWEAAAGGGQSSEFI